MKEIELLKNNILDLAFSGKLNKVNHNGTLENLILDIEKAKGDKLSTDCFLEYDEMSSSYYYKTKRVLDNDGILFDLPCGWKWIRLGDFVEKVTDFVASGSFQSLRDNVKYYKEKNYAILVKTQDFQSNFKYSLTFTDKHGYDFLSNSNLHGGELILTNIGSIGKVFIVPQLNYPMTLAPNSIMIKTYKDYQIKWLYYYFKSKNGLKNLLSISSGTTMKKFNKTDLRNIFIPIAPLEQQNEIISKIEYIFSIVENLDKDIEDIKNLKHELKEKVLDIGIKGRLYKGEENLGNAIDELKNNRFFIENNHETIDDGPFNIKSTWTFVKLGDVLNIQRGGSPRPIDAYITSSKDSYNWIKIGDTIKGDKYITKTAQKIKKEGLHRTRYVEPGDFILSNSMSFGRPYILKIDGCIHDGWLVFRKPDTAFDKDFLFYLLSSNFVYKQFLDVAHGSGVKNLNIERVKGTIIPLPPIKEQKEIAKKIDMLLEKIELM